jgi:hypothetical protein
MFEEFQTNVWFDPQQMEAAIYFYYATKECTPTKMSCGE